MVKRIITLSCLLFAASLSAQVIKVTSLKCTDAAGKSKTSFAVHGETANCTVTLSASVPAGSLIAPYTVTAPAFLTPAATTLPAGSISVNVGGLQWAFITPATTGLSVTTAGTTFTFTVTWP